MDLGLVVNNSDGKVTSIHLTESGKNIFAMCQVLKELMHTLILQDFTDEELECLAHLIAKMDNRMDNLLESLKTNR
jgi:DNA-binding MarR family transcriptional regulator